MGQLIRPPAQRLRALLFDWDGTIVDSRQAMFDSIRYAYQKHLGIVFPKDMDEFRRVSPMRLAESTALYAGERAAEVAADYKWYYTHEAYKITDVFPGMRETLRELRRRGYALGVVTNTNLERLSADMRHLDLESAFDAIVTSEDTTERKPHPAPLLKGLEKLAAAGLVPADLSPSEAAYTGDYPGDMQAAHAADMFAVAGLWGGIFLPESLLAEQPDCVLEKPEGLLQIFL